MTPLDQFIAAVSDEMLRFGWNLGEADDNGKPLEDDGSLAWAIRKHANLVTGITPDRADEIQRDIAETEARLEKLRRELREIGGAQ